MRRSCESLQWFYDYIDLENRKETGTIEIDLARAKDYIVEFKNVSFKYPSSDIYSLEHVSIRFNIGERVAVVGKNVATASDYDESIVLDEPTVALDPIAEADIYNQLNELIQDKTAIYISHHLSSCYFCQQIAVFDKGSLIQHGSHKILVEDKNGLYYEL